MVFCVRSRHHLPGAHWSSPFSLSVPYLPPVMWHYEPYSSGIQWVQCALGKLTDRNDGWGECAISHSTKQASGHVSTCNSHSKHSSDSIGVINTQRWLQRHWYAGLILFSSPDAQLFSSTLLFGELWNISPLNSCVITGQSLNTSSGCFTCQAGMGERDSCWNKCSPGLVPEAKKKGNKMLIINIKSTQHSHHAGKTTYDIIPCNIYVIFMVLILTNYNF